MELEYQGTRSPSMESSVLFSLEEDFPETQSFNQAFPATNSSYHETDFFRQKTLKKSTCKTSRDVSESDHILLDKIQNLGLTAKLNKKDNNNKELSKVSPNPKFIRQSSIDSTEVSHIPRFTRRSSIETIPRNHMDFDYYPELYSRGNSSRRFSEGFIKFAEDKLQQSQTESLTANESALQEHDSENRSIFSDKMNFNIPNFKSYLSSDEHFKNKYLILSDYKCRKITNFNPFASATKMINRSCSTECLKLKQNKKELLKRNSTEIFNTLHIEEDSIDDIDKNEDNVGKNGECSKCAQHSKASKSELSTCESDKNLATKPEKDLNNSESQHQESDTDKGIYRKNSNSDDIKHCTKKSVKWIKTNKIRQTKREQNVFFPSNF